MQAPGALGKSIARLPHARSYHRDFQHPLGTQQVATMPRSGAEVIPPMPLPRSPPPPPLPGGGGLTHRRTGLAAELPFVVRFNLTFASTDKLCDYLSVVSSAACARRQ